MLNKMTHAEDPKHVLRKAVEGVQYSVPGYYLLVATYVRPEKTAGGLFLTDRMRDEDKFQGKVGLVLAVGPDAYKDAERFPSGPRCTVGDWILHRFGEGTPFELNGHPCRIINDDAVKLVLHSPDGVM